MFTVCQSEQIEQTCGRRVANRNRLPPITKLRLGLELLPGQRTWDRMFFCCCIFSFFSSSFPSSCLFFVFLFLLFCFQTCVSSSRSNNAGQRTTDHMFHEHTDCSRQGEESSFVSNLRFTFRFSRSVYFFVIACFLFDSLLFTDTHTYGSEEMVGFVRLGDVREESSFV